MNRQVHLVAYPDGPPEPGCFRLVEADEPRAGEGEALVRVTHLSMDPFPRLRMRADSRVGPPLPLDRVVDGRGVGFVEESHDPSLKAGDLVAGDLGWQARVALPAAKLQKLDATLGPPERHLSTLAPSGLTAFFAAEKLATDTKTLVIAPAAGSVGALAGQIARARGARVVGVVSGAAQARFLRDELGFDAAIESGDADADALAEACPDGVDAFLDGVGGPLHDAVMARLNVHGRVLLLGFIAGYNDAEPPRYGSALPVLFKRASVEGFLLADHQARFGEALRGLKALLDAGSVRSVENVWRGLTRAPAAFASLFADAAPGKQIVQVEEG